MTSEKEIIISRPKGERNGGIDFLKIIAMFMVVLLHVWGPGGILFEVKSGTAHFQAAWLLEFMLFCAINCYGIISGYVCLTSRYRYTNLVMLWLQVALYNVLLTAYYFFTQPGVVSKSDLIASFFPVSNNTYWYFTAYAGMFLLIPIFNRAAHSLSKKQFASILATLFVALCVLPCIFNRDIFATGWGYSTLWLSFLYLTGAYIKMYGFFNNNPLIALSVYALSVLISWGVKLFEEYLAPSAYWSDLASGRVAQYTSPFMFLAGLSLVVVFSNLRLPKTVSKIASVVAPCTFGVYILHTQVNVWYKIITYKYASFVNYPVYQMILAAVGVALCIFAVLWIVDYIRSVVFKLLHIKQHLLKLEDKLLGNIWN